MRLIDICGLSHRLDGWLVSSLEGKKAKLSREDLNLPDRLTDYSCVSNATIYESNFHVSSPYT